MRGWGGVFKGWGGDREGGEGERVWRGVSGWAKGVYGVGVLGWRGDGERFLKEGEGKEIGGKGEREWRGIRE